MLFARALVAFVLMPGTVAFLIPWFLIAPPGGSDAFASSIGLLPLAVGTIVLLWCVREFYVAGRATLAPWAPPQTVVVTGLYRCSRNPMYVGVLLILCGWAIGFQSWDLAIYAGAIALAFHLRVVLNEEPFLARTHGETWTTYKARVSRWIGPCR